jgi:hypothetical protein
VKRDLFNHFVPDVPPNTVVTTARCGTKWADLRPGDTIRVHSGTCPADQKFEFEGEVVSVEVLAFDQVTAKDVATNACTEARSYYALLSKMEAAYPGFSPGEVITVVRYRRK